MIGRKTKVRQEQDGRLYVSYKSYDGTSRYYAPADTVAAKGMEARTTRQGHDSGFRFRPPFFVRSKKVQAATMIVWVPTERDTLYSEKWVEDWDGTQPPEPTDD